MNVMKDISDYIPVKNSQISFYKTLPLYCFSDNGEAVLYKKKGNLLPKSRRNDSLHPPLFIHKNEKKIAFELLQKELNIELASKISSKGLKPMKKILCQIVEEALSGPIEEGVETLPETLEILFSGYSKNMKLLESLVKISVNAPVTVEHSVNILALTVQYCFTNAFSKDEIEKMCICAVLHDIGCTRIEREILESRDKLTNQQFAIYKTHTLKGYRIIKSFSGYSPVVAEVARDHHERLDGSGYPSNRSKISFESQLIALIDSYEQMTYRSKTFRKALPAYGTLQIIKDDVIKGKYDKKLFANFCSCLTR